MGSVAPPSSLNHSGPGHILNIFCLPIITYPMISFYIVVSILANGTNLYA